MAVYPGSFDPVTNGHVDIIERASPLFGELIIAVGVNSRKQSDFSVEERLDMLREVTSHLDNVRVDSFDGLLVEYAASLGAVAVIRGLRLVADFEYELQQVLMNKQLCPDIETLFLMTNNKYSYLSSSIVKEVSRLGGSLDGLVPPSVEMRLRRWAGHE